MRPVPLVSARAPAILPGVPGDVLLLSNSRPPGGAEPFAHAREVLASHLAGLRAAPDCRYTGSSAGTNLACPTVMTTNDMPIVDPGGLDALARVPFQVNPHYLDPDPRSTHQGETREERIGEFHEMNHVPV